MDNQEPKGIFYCLLLLVNLIDPLLDLVLEAALGYFGAISTSLMGELASLNERCDLSIIDVKMEDLARRIVALIGKGIRDREVVWMMGVEDRERSQRWNKRAMLETRHLKREIESLRTQLSDERRARWDLARSHAELRTLTNGLVQTVDDLRDDLARLMRRVSNGLPRARPLVDSARMAAEPIHMLIEHEGCLVEIGEVDWAKDEIVLDSTRGSPARDFLAKEEEQAQEARWNNELMFHAEVEAVQADPALEYEGAPEYQDPPLNN